METFDQKQFENWKKYLNAKQSVRDPVKNPVVAYGGTAGSYSEDAAIAYFGKEALRVACRRFEDVFKSVAAGTADYGVIPIENSTTGSVKDVLDTMLHFGLFIVGEVQVRVDHCLLGLPGTDSSEITDIYSHEQSLSQCAVYLEAHPGWELHPYVNNALAAEYVAAQGEKKNGAIASARAGALHGLEVLEGHINFLDINTTRFIVIADHMETGPAHDKLSFSFSVRHKPGALVRVLNIFDVFDLNLCRIESRPNRVENWQYVFFVDIEGSISSAGLDAAVHRVIRETTDFRFLGNYRADTSA